MKQMNIEDIVKHIVEFRESNGFQWKRKLKESLLNGTQRNPGLVQFRNRYTFDTLDKIKSITTIEDIIEIIKKDSRI